jgi:hypothetical protein
MTHGSGKVDIGWVNIKSLEVYDPGRCILNHDPITILRSLQIKRFGITSTLTVLDQKEADELSL